MSSLLLSVVPNIRQDLYLLLSRGETIDSKIVYNQEDILFLSDTISQMFEEYFDMLKSEYSKKYKKMLYDEIEDFEENEDKNKEDEVEENYQYNKLQNESENKKK